MRHKSLVLMLALTAALWAPGALAQHAPDRPAPGEPSFGSFGADGQDYWVVATEFAPLDPANQLEYQTFMFWASATGGTFLAHVGLPAGGEITGMRCYFFDSDAAADGNVILQKHIYDWVTLTPTIQNISPSISSSGSPGYQDLFLAFSETVHYRTPSTDDIYVLTANLPASTDVRLRGCRIFWHRQVSPAPLAASFGDVPTTHPFFQFVEALVDAGITVGCGGGNYCPDDPLTRGQMAVFLSVALGLHSPF